MRPSWSRHVRVWVLIVASVLVSSMYTLVLTTAPTHAVSLASAAGTIDTPIFASGASGRGDQRDADLYPTIVYGSGHYLLVWMTVRNAGSSSDGFDIYGRFLDTTGQPQGKEFRISDTNSAARSSLSSVAASNNEFVVAWTARNDKCRIYVQRIVDDTAQPDQVLIAGSVPSHSPSIVYNPLRQSYALAYVEGDDYLPPTSFGAQTASCGNSAKSTSNIKALEFGFDGNVPQTLATSTISSANAGAFRPSLAYNSTLQQYFVVWEDRRQAAGKPYLFDVYGQHLDNTMAITGADMVLASGGDYTNYDTSATWTPRPAIAAQGNTFLAAWFSRQVEDDTVTWSVDGQRISSNAAIGAPLTITEMTFAESHTGQAPSGALSIASSALSQEYVVGITSYIESFFGYYSFCFIQRVTEDGQLLKLDGSIQSQASVGTAVDVTNDNQLNLTLASNTSAAPGVGDYMLVYSKHSLDASATDFNIWSARLQIGSSLSRILLPIISKPVATSR